MTTPRVQVRIPHDRWLTWLFHHAAAALGETSNWDAMTNAAAGGTSTRDPEARMTDRRMAAAQAHRYLRRCLGSLSESTRRTLRVCYDPRPPVDDERHIALVFGSAFALAVSSEAAERQYRAACAAWKEPPRTVAVFLARACVGNRDAELQPVVEEVAGAITAALYEWESTAPGVAAEWISP